MGNTVEDITLSDRHEGNTVGIARTRETQRIIIDNEMIALNTNATTSVTAATITPALMLVSATKMGLLYPLGLIGSSLVPKSDPMPIFSKPLTIKETIMNMSYREDRITCRTVPLGFHVYV